MTKRLAAWAGGFREKGLLQVDGGWLDLDRFCNTIMNQEED